MQTGLTELDKRVDSRATEVSVFRVNHLTTVADLLLGVLIHVKAPPTLHRIEHPPPSLILPHLPILKIALQTERRRTER